MNACEEGSMQRSECATVSPYTYISCLVWKRRSNYYEKCTEWTNNEEAAYVCLHAPFETNNRLTLDLVLAAYAKTCDQKNLESVETQHGLYDTLHRIVIDVLQNTSLYDTFLCSRKNIYIYNLCEGLQQLTHFSIWLIYSKMKWQVISNYTKWIIHERMKNCL
jgi:hypothetical protein